MDNTTVVMPRPPKSPGFAGFLGMFPFGLGALYNGQRAKALLYLVVFAGLINAMDRHSSGAFVPLLFDGLHLLPVLRQHPLGQGHQRRPPPTCRRPKPPWARRRS